MKRWIRSLAVMLAVAALVPSAAYAYYATVTANITFSASFSESISTGLISPLYVGQGVSQTDTYSSGTGSGQADTPYAAQLTLVASTPQTIDLTALKDPAGNAINFARVREFIVQNTATTAGYDCKVYAGTTNPVAWLPPSASAIYCRYGSVIRISDKVSTGAGNGNIVGATAKSVTFDPGSNGPIVVNVWALGGSSQ
jgi:hypothetical protein